MTNADIIGIMGMLSLIVPYLLLLFRKIHSCSYPFLFSNLIGALLLFTNGLMIGVPWFYPLINSTWAVGTIYQIIHEWRTRKKKKRLRELERLIIGWYDR